MDLASASYEPQACRIGNTSIGRPPVWRPDNNALYWNNCDGLPHLGLTRSPQEIDLMRRFKDALDPAGLLNPGKVVG